MKILSKYVLKEHAGPLLFAGATLTSLLLLNYIAKHFGSLVGKGLPWSAIAQFFALSVPFTVAMTLPMAVLISTLYAFSRLAAENEVTALKASGVGMPQVMVPVIGAAAIVAMIMIAFNDQILSRSNHQLAVLQTDIARTKPTFALREQTINPVSPGRLYVRANKIDRATNRMREVTIYDLADATRGRTIFAQSGLLGFSEDRKDLVMTLFDGYMQEVSAADPGQLQRLFFRRNQMRVRGIGSKFEESQNVEYKGPREKTICEMHADYVTAERMAMRAREDFANTLANAAYTAATGIYRGPTPSSTMAADSAGKLRAVPVTLGGMYCAFVKKIGVEEAQAAPAPQFSGSRRRRARERELLEKQRLVDSSAVPDTARASTPGVTRPLPPSAGLTHASDYVPNATSFGTLDGLRSRLSESVATRNLYLVEIHKKFALAVACLIFVLIGAPVALRFPRGGVGLVISVSLGVFALYYIGLIAGQTLAENGTLSPFWAMWMANIVFGIIGLALLARMGKEQSTSRGGDMREMLEMLRAWFARWGRKLGLKTERRMRER